jgi:alpha-beta hydrolase superfamily lysophospholipase
MSFAFRRSAALALGALLAAFAPPLAAAPPRAPDPVELTTADGQRIVGFWLSGDAGAPAVLLLHDAGRDHHGFRPLWERLRRTGTHVLALDLRGHGASQRHTPEAFARMSRHETEAFREMIHDAEAGLAFLTRTQKVPESRIAVVGAEVGCTIGFELMARHPKLACMAALSPAMQSHGLRAAEPLRRYGARPLLIVTTKRLLATGPQAIHDQLAKTARVHMEVFVGDAVRGVDLLGQRTDIEGLVTAWLQGNLLQKR